MCAVLEHNMPPYGGHIADKAIELAAVHEDTYITLRSILNSSESISFACIVILSEPYAGEEFKFISSKYLIISGKIDD